MTGHARPQTAFLILRDQFQNKRVLIAWQRWIMPVGPQPADGTAQNPPRKRLFLRPQPLDTRRNPPGGFRYITGVILAENRFQSL